MTKRRLTMCRAAAKAASTASASPDRNSPAILPGFSSHRGGQSGSTARAVSTLAGSASKPISISSAASLALSTVSAITRATGSPT